MTRAAARGSTPAALASSPAEGVVTLRSVCAAHHMRDGNSTKDRGRQPAEPISGRTCLRRLLINRHIDVGLFYPLLWQTGVSPDFDPLPDSRRLGHFLPRLETCSHLLPVDRCPEEMTPWPEVR